MRSSGSETIEVTSEERPDEELVVGFWTLVLLIKLLVVLSGAAIFVFLFTDFHLIGFAIILIGVGISMRWYRLYRSIRS